MGLLVTLVTVSALPAAAQEHEDAADCSQSAPTLSEATEERALALAAECDDLVEIRDWRTWTSQSFALPDGAVRTETFTQPQWTLDDEDEWVDIDPTLQVESDGTITTTATVSRIGVSPGGTGPFITLTTPSGETLGLVWPGELPQPQIEANTAVYPNVLPEIDLRLEVDNERFSYMLVVHTPEAAQEADLGQVDLDVIATGLTVRQDPDTDLIVAFDAEGREVYIAEPALMWDSSTSPLSTGLAAPESEIASVDPLDVFGIAPDGPVEQVEPPAHSEAHQSDVPGRVSEMAVAFDGQTMTVVPDAEMLADPATEYPVFIDPSFTGALLSYANVHQQRPNTAMLSRGADLRVGVQTWNTNDITYGRWRAAVRFDLSGIDNRYVNSAKVTVLQTHMGGCEDRYMRLWRVKRITGSNTTWNNIEPLEGGYLQSVLVPSSNKVGCTGKKDELVTYNSSNVTNVVRRAVNGGNGEISFMFQSSNESVQDGMRAWRKLAVSSAKLIVDHRPKSSTNLKTDGKNCSTSGPGPWVSSTTPTLSAKAPEFTGSSGWLRFHLYTPSNSDNIHNWWVSANSGQTVTSTIPSGQLAAGKTYRWRVLAYDTKTSAAHWQDMSRCWFRVNSPPQVPNALTTEGLGCGTQTNPTMVTTRTPKLSATPRDPDGKDGGKVKLRYRFYRATGENIREWLVDGDVGVAIPTRVQAGLASPDGLYRWRVQTVDAFASSDWSSYCWMRVDTTAPEPPDVVQVTTDPASGQPVTFDLIGGTDVKHFRYGIQGQSTTVLAAASGKLRVTVTPPAGPLDHVLQVWARDAAGNESSRTDAWFSTATQGEVHAVAAWRFDGDGFDDSGNDNEVTSGDGLRYGTDRAGRSDAALNLNATPGSCPLTDGPLLDTQESYTVAAWVRPRGGNTEWPKLFAQGAEVRGGFYLEWSTTADRWVFQLPQTDAASTAWARVYSNEPPAVAEWQHVTGVYDAAAERVRLYIDGVLQGSAPVPFEPLESPAAFSIGCMNRIDGNVFGVLDADIDDVVVYQDMLTGGQIADLVAGRGLSAAMQSWYPLRGDGQDYSRRGSDLTDLSSESDWVNDQHGRQKSALRLDGTACPRPGSVPVRSDEAFSISAWVRLDEDHTSAHPPVWSLHGNGGIAALVKYNGSHDKWELTMQTTDDQAAAFRGVVGTHAPVKGAWTHLAATVDPDTRRIQLFVNGELSGSHTIAHTVWRASGLAIGCSGLSYFSSKWEGDIADVRIWRGALEPERINGSVTELRAFWELDEDTGGTDSWGSNDLTFHGSHTWVENRFNECFASFGLGLDGAGHGRTARPVLTTDESFTVTAWVKLTDKEGYRTVAAQTGSNFGAFNINYNPLMDRFQISMPQSDSTSVGWQRVAALEAPEFDELDDISQWYHIVGQVDLGAGVIRLYIDGELQGETPVVASPWRAEGPFTIGAAEQLGAIVNPMHGMIDQVHAYSGVLDELWIKRLADERPWDQLLPDGSCEIEEPPPLDW